MSVPVSQTVSWYPHRIMSPKKLGWLYAVSPTRELQNNVGLRSRLDSQKVRFRVQLELRNSLMVFLLKYLPSWIICYCHSGVTLYFACLGVMSIELMNNTTSKELIKHSKTTPYSRCIFTTNVPWDTIFLLPMSAHIICCQNSQYIILPLMRRSQLIWYANSKNVFLPFPRKLS